jgi:hypothetical protein
MPEEKYRLIVLEIFSLAFACATFVFASNALRLSYCAEPMIIHEKQLQIGSSCRLTADPSLR